MKKEVKLTRRETEIVELLAWGATKKEIASQLFISEHTVENHTRAIFEKTGCRKVSEVSAWWFCTTYHIPFDFSPLKCKQLAIGMLMIVFGQIFYNGNHLIRTFREREFAAAKNVFRTRRKTDTVNLLDLLKLA